MDMITISAKTLDEAITKALLELQTTSEHLYYEVVQKESSGFLGIFGGKQCVIRARVMGEEEEKNKKEEEDKRVRIIEEKAKIEAKKLEKARIEKKEKEELEKNQNSVKDGKTVKSEERIVVEKTTEKLSEELKTEKVSKKYSEQRDSEKKKYERKDGRADGHEKTDRRNIELHEKSEPRMRAEVKMDEAVVQRKAKEFLDQIFNAMGMQVSIETSVNVEEGEEIEQGTLITVVISKGQLKMESFTSAVDFRAWAESYGINYKEEYEFIDSNILLGILSVFNISFKLIIFTLLFERFLILLAIFIVPSSHKINFVSVF